jgi:phosphomevalonate kinase
VHIAEEVRAAMPPPFPHIDASQLRSDGRKLGLGSSAAIVVASLATLPEHAGDALEDRQRLYQRALFAHREAQGGGSGIDVAAATFGGNVLLHYDPEGPGRVISVALPPLHFEVWSCPEAAVTSGFLRRVREFKGKSPEVYAELFARLTVAAREAASACETQNGGLWLRALECQAAGLHELGVLAEVPIFTDEVTALRDQAISEGAVVMPAGAGGGDLALFCGQHPPSANLLAAARTRGVNPLRLKLGALGVQRLGA